MTDAKAAEAAAATEATDPNAAPKAEVQPSAGQMLRQARMAAGLHIGTLAASIKVPVRKLELLEADRFDELPDAAFTRALAQTVCRALKIDASPVLARLPRVSDPQGLEQLSGGLNAPFREAGGGARPGGAGLATQIATGVTVLLLLGAVVMLLVPQFWPMGSDEDTASEPVAAAPAVLGEPVAPGANGTVVLPSPPSAPATTVNPTSTPDRPAEAGAAPEAQPERASGGVAAAGSADATPASPSSVASPAPAPAAPVPPSASTGSPGAVPPASTGDGGAAAPSPAVGQTAAAQSPASGEAAASASSAVADAAAAPSDEVFPPEMSRFAVVLLTTDRSWVELRDADGKVLLSRLLEPGTPVGVDGRYPISVIVGNAGATQLWSRGQSVDLGAVARENVARVQLR